MLNNSNLYGSGWLALVFSNRNQNYGAYVLRSQSSSILLRAMLIVIPVFIMLFVGPAIYAQLHKKDVATANVRNIPVNIEPIHDMKKELPKKEEQIKQEQAPPLKQPTAATTNFTANIQLVDETPVEPPTAVEVQQTVIASTTQEGTLGGVNGSPTPSTGIGNGTSNEEVSPSIIYETAGVEIYPEFPGGMDAWAKFIQRNLRYPYTAQESNIQGKVYLSFVVERDGSISDVKVTRGIGYGCDDEAVRVIKKSPKWKAGQQNKQTVRVRYNMPINYTLSQ
jgi:protein TonB